MKTAGLFEVLKSEAMASNWFEQKEQDLYFQLIWNEGNCLLRTVNKTGGLINADYRAFNGAERELLRALELTESDAYDRFVWDETEREEVGLSLSDYSHLVWLLARCEHVVDEAFSPITFHLTPMEFELRLLRDGRWLEGTLGLCSESEGTVALPEGQMISETHVYANHTVYVVQPIGSAFRSLPLFEDRFSENQLNEVLTLLASSFTHHVKLAFENYQVINDQAISAKPALLIQQVDDHDALHLEIALSLPGFSVDFLRDYNIVRAAYVDEIEQLIRVREVEYTALMSARADLLQRLKKMERSVKSAEAYLIQDEGGLVLGPDLANEFLRSHLVELTAEFELLGAEKLKTYKVKQVTPQLNVSLDHGLDFLEGTAELELEGESFSLFEALQQYKKNAYVKLNDGSQALLSAKYMEKLGRLFKKQKKGVKVSFFDLPLIEDLIEERAEKSEFPKSKAVFEGFNKLGSRKLQMPQFAGTLRPYQKQGVSWLDYLHKHKLGGCLADDMGLGKTIQAIALLTRIYPKEKKPSLLVMPKSLLFNWQRELNTFGPSLTYYVYYADQRDLEKAQKYQIILTTYGTLRSDAEVFSQEEFHAVILDESQAIKNPKSQAAQAAMALKSAFRLALSGTPVENNLGELYSLFRFLNPTMLGSAGEFERNYLYPIQRLGDKEVANELRHKIYPFILRRLKKDVLKELPPKVEQVLFVDMSKEQREYYESRRMFYQAMVKSEIEKSGLAKSRFMVLEALSELRQIASVPEAKSDGRIRSSKREVLLETLQDAVLNGRKCLVFTNFLAGIEQVSELLNEFGIEHVTMSGSTSNRQQLVERFQHDASVKVFVMTLKTGGVGLNLTAADTVFILDPWWNTSAEAQAVDRTHRMGQKKTVFTYRLIARETIEEKIQALQQKKKELVDQIISSDGAALKSLSEADINQLLGA